MDTISEMIGEITTELPLFEKYRNIFPNAFELEDPLRDLYSVYVTFCIDVFLFLKSKEWSKDLQFMLVYL